MHVFLEIDLATCGSEELLVIETPLGQRPLSLADIGIAPNGFIYGMDSFEGLYKIDLEEGEVVNSWPLPFGIQYGGMAIDADGLILLSGQDGRLATFDIESEEFTDLGKLDDDFPVRLTLSGIAFYRDRLFGSLVSGHLVEIFLDEMRAEYIMESMNVEQSLYIYEEECDDPVFITGTNRGTVRLLDPDLDTFYNLCQFDIGSAIFTGITSYTEYQGYPDCRDTIDLNATESGFDHFFEDICGTGRAYIAHDSVKVYGDYPLDSIRLVIVEDPDGVEGTLEAVENLGMTVSGSGTDEVFAEGFLDYADWEVWLRQVEYVSTADPPTPGLRRIAVVGYFNEGETTDTAWAEIEVLQPDFSAGEGAVVEECPSGNEVSLFDYLSGADPDGNWVPDVPGGSLELLPDNSGTYFYTVDHPDCGSDTAVLELFVWPGPEVSVEGAGSLCAGQTATLELTGDLDDVVSFLWNTGSTESEIEVSESGTYWVRMAYGEDCIWSDTVEVTVEELLTIEEEISLCPGQSLDWHGQTIEEAGQYETVLTGQAGECDTALVLTVEEGEWIVTELSAEICPGEVFEFQGEELSEPGEYEFFLTAETGCDTLLSLQLSWTDPPELIEEISICPGEVYEFQGEELTEPGEYEFVLSAETGCDTLLSLQINWADSPELIEEISICPGEVYEIQGEELTEPGEYEFVLSSESGCDTLLRIYLEEAIVPEASILGPDRVCEGEAFELIASPAEELDQIFWNTGQSSPTIEVVEPGIYSFEARTAANCEVMAEKRIEDCPSRQIYIPNAFSPNGDGVNDEWQIYTASEVERMELKIYDRWGSRVYEEISTEVSWDGRFRGEDLPVGVYVYQLVVEFDSEYVETFSGEVVLMR